MTIPSVVLSNTFNEFRTITNQAIAQLNALESGTGSIVADNVNANLVNASVALRANNVTTLTGGTLVINTNGGVNTGSITVNSGLNGNIAITPNGTGNVVVTSLNATGNVNVTGTLGVTGATTFGSALTVSTGTSNGVMYLNTSKNITTGSNLTFNGANLGIGTSSPQSRLDIITALNSGIRLYETGAVNAWNVYTSGNNLRIIEENVGTVLHINAGGSIGIGTTSPASKLHVNGDIQHENANYIKGKLSTGTSTRLFGLNSSNTLYIGSVDADHNGGTLFVKNGVTQVQITPSGNVGIGTSNPAGKFDVVGSAYIGANTNNSLFVDSTATLVTIGAAGRTSFSNTDLRFLTSNGSAALERMRITYDGLVGINTTSITARFEVQSSGVMTRFKTGSAADGRVEWAYNTTDVGYVGVDTSTEFSIFARSGNTLKFGAGGVERARIASTGNFGIGVTNPGYTLDVGGAIQANTFFRLDSSGTLVGAIGYASSLLGSGGNDWLFYNTQATNIRFYTNNLERLRLDSSGNLGLGVTPKAWTVRAFEILGSASLSSVVGTDLTYNAYYDGSWKYTATAVAARYAQIASTGAHAWYTAPSGTAGNAITFTQAMTLDASGRLLLGTTSSTGARIDSNGDVAGVFDGLNVSNQSLNSAAVTRITLGSQGANWLLDNIRNGGHLSFTRGTTEAARFDSSGNFGIGTTSPGGLLGVNGAVVIGNQATTGTDGSLRLITSGGINYIQSGQNRTTANAAPLVFADMNASSEWMRITNTGSVGIGTSSPATNLEVSGSAARVRVSGTAGSIAQLQLSSAGVVNWALRANNDGGSDFTIFQDSTQRLKIDSSGNVGIGTNSPSFRVDAVDSTSATIRARTSSSGNAALIASTAAGGVAYLQLTNAAGDHYIYGGTGGTQNISFAINGEKMRLDASGNLGLGVTPAAWGANYRALEVRTGSIYDPAAGTAFGLTFNAFHNGTNWIYKGTGGTATAMRYQMDGAGHAWHIAPNDISGNTVPFTQAMTLNASGNLGVGLTTQGARIHASAPDGVVYQLAASGTTRGVRFETNSTETRIVGVDQTLTATFQPLSIGGSQVVIRTSGTTETARFASGNLGLGVTPSAWFTASSIDFGVYGGLSNNSGGGGGFALYANSFEDTSGNYKYKQSYFAALYRTFAGQHQWFNAPSGTAGANVSFTQAMTLTATGSLGIGVTNPIQRLEVNGNIRTIAGSGGTLSLFESDGTRANHAVLGADADGIFLNSTFSTGGSGVTRFLSANSERMRIDSSGNVGIGTTTPGVRLDVNGGSIRTTSWVDITPSTATNNALYRATNTGGIFYSGLDNSVGGVTGVGYAGVLWHTGAGPIIFGVNSAEQMRLSTTGLGVGTNAPNAKLDVRPSTNNIVQIKSATHSTLTGLSSAVSFSRGNDGAEDLAAVFGWNNGGLAMSAREGLVFATGGSVGFAATTERMRLDTSGNLGIGTSSPTNYGAGYTTLAVNGSVAGVLDLAAGGVSQFRLFGNTFENRLQGVTNAPITFFTNNTEKMRLDSSGNLGLGVTPSAWLGAGYIDFPSNGYIGNASTYSSNTLSLGLNAYYGSGNWRYKTSSLAASRFDNGNGSFTWHTAGSGTAGNAISFTQVMTLDANGDLSVGATSPYNAARISSLATTTKNAFSAYVPATSSYTGFYVNRIASDGDFITFDRDTVRIGSIQSSSNSLIVLIGNATEAIRITPTTARVGIGDSNPAEKLTVSGTIQASEGLKLNSGNTYTDVISFTTSSTSQVTLQSVTAGTYRSGKYFVQITSGTSYQVLELTLLHDGANVYMSQYGEIATGSNLGTFDANINAGNMNLLFTPTNAVTKVRLTSTLVKQY